MRGSPRHSDMQLVRLVTFALTGFLVGGALGYMFIGTAHAILLSRNAEHYSDTSTTSTVGRLPGSPVRPGNVPVLQQDAASNGTSDVSSQALVKGDVVHPNQGAPTYPSTGTTIHTLCTSNGSPYLNFQTRIMYGTYQLVQKMSGGDQLVAFTRILHRSSTDVLMNEVPTWRANPLTPACDQWCEFPVSDRPNAVRQFFQAAKEDATLIKAPWLLMVETDYVWVHPLQAPRAEDPAAPSMAFHFDYIRPDAPNLEKVIRRMYPAEKGLTSSIPASGPAPVLMRWEEWFKVVDDWERLTAHIEADKESKEQLGWVREMYAFSIAAALQDVPLQLALPPESPLIAQPPHDSRMGAAAMMHYTWGSIFTHPANKSEVWKFDKRFYTEASIQINTPRIPMPPPYQEGWTLEDGRTPVTQELYDTVSGMLQQMNTAINLLPVAS